MDKIILENMKVYGSHGVYAYEKRKRQSFIIDLYLTLDLIPASTSDFLESTLDYVQIETIVASIVEKRSFNLIEKLALTIIEELFKNFEILYSVKIRLKKPKALPHYGTIASVELERLRTDFFSSTVFLGLGSNLGDREAHLDEAFQRIEALPKTKIVEHSPIYNTTAIGTAGRNYYLNCCLKISTRLTPKDLQRELQNIEQIMGRDRKKRWDDRTIDIDMLYYNRYHFNTPFLQLPHPRIKERAFVLKPLLDLSCPFINIEDFQKVENQTVEIYKGES